MTDQKHLSPSKRRTIPWALPGLLLATVLSSCRTTPPKSSHPTSDASLQLHPFETRSLGQPNGNTVMSVAFIPETSYAVASTGDGTATLWDTSTAKELRHFSSPGFTFASIAVSADGKNALTTGFKSNIHLWSLSNGKDIASLPVVDTPQLGIALSPDGSRAAVSYDNVVHLWTFSSGALQPSVKIPASTTGMAFTNGDKTLVWVQDDAHVCRWDLDPNAAPSCATLAMDDLAAHVAASKDGSKLLIGGHHLLVFWDVATASALHTWNTKAGELSSIALSPDGTQALWSDDRASVHLWNTQTGSQIAGVKGPGQDDVSLSFSDDGSRALLGGGDGTLKLWALK